MSKALHARPLVLIVGSLNADLVQRVPRMPAIGETLSGGDLQIFAGGKGANQACAAARLAARTKMAGQLGDDAFGGKVVQELESSGVDVSLVSRTASPTGTATILVFPQGDNCIVLAPGANGQVTPEFASAAAVTLQPGDFLLCQLEIPIAAVEAAIHIASSRQATVILDPAPAVPLGHSLLSQVRILTPNQTEAALLLGCDAPPQTLEEGLQAASRLQKLGPQTVIVKMGELGCAVADGTEVYGCTTTKVQAVDSTAAGDTFNGALAAGLSENMLLPDAIRFANAAAAISVMHPGAISSMPWRRELTGR